MDNNEPTLRTISHKYFDITKRWWLGVWLCKLLVFLVGISGIFWPQANFQLTFVTATLILISEVCDWTTSHYRSRAETLLRKLDLFDSFGWEIKPTEIADQFVGLSKKARAKLAENTGTYFASKEGPGTRRALENLRESAWWSKHLSGNMRVIIWVIATILIIVSVGVLIFSSSLINSTDQAVTISRIVISVLLLIVSLRLIPLALNYGSFSNKSKDIENYVCDALKVENSDEIQVVKAFNEYHLARAVAPLIPSWLWKLRRNSLNEVWDEHITNS
jgi:hypothetical protein